MASMLNDEYIPGWVSHPVDPVIMNTPVGLVSSTASPTDETLTSGDTLILIDD